MAAVRPWVPRALLFIAGITLFLVIAQYLLGLWTNLYAPATFNSNTSYPSLDWHYNIGYALFVASVVMVIFAALMKDARFVAPAVVVVIAVVLAGVFGGLFVASTPNSPVDSLLMGFMALLAFGATLAVVWNSVYRRSSSPMAGQPKSDSSPAN